MIAIKVLLICFYFHNDVIEFATGDPALNNLKSRIVGCQSKLISYTCHNLNS